MYNIILSYYYSIIVLKFFLDRHDTSIEGTTINRPLVIHGEFSGVGRYSLVLQEGLNLLVIFVSGL